MATRLKAPTHISAKETMLLVDDEPIILEMVARLLELQGYAIVKANNAEEALLVTEEYAGTFDLLLPDVVMPGMNGDDLAQYPGVKCLFNTAGEDLGTIENLMINLLSTRVTYAVLSFGGFLGLGEKYFVIPMEAMAHDPDDQAFILNIPS